MQRNSQSHRTGHRTGRRTDHRTGRRTGRRGFTLIELIVAGVIAIIVVATIGTSILQLSRARESSKIRLNAHLRANAALDRVRKEIQQVIRSDNLIDTRVLLVDGTIDSPIGDLARNDLLIYSTKLTPVRTKTYEGDGIEHEVQMRVVEDEAGSALWMRSDAVPDDNELGGGSAEPVMDGIIGLHVEAFDGMTWFDTWDSDIFGLPAALRITVSSAGDAAGQDVYADTRDLMSLRTIVPIDRVMKPYEEPVVEESSSMGEESTAAAGAGGAGGGAAAAAATGGGAQSADPTAGAVQGGGGFSGGRGGNGGMGRGNEGGVRGGTRGGARGGASGGTRGGAGGGAGGGMGNNRPNSPGSQGPN